MTNIYQVKVEELAKWVKDDNVYIVDVREPIEYNSENINLAVNLPLSQIKTIETQLPNHHNNKLILQCRSGQRSQKACEIIQSLGVNYDVWNLEGGIEAWKRAGLTVNTNGKKILALDRQVQITLGLLIITGIILGHVIAYPWFLLPLMIGLGLLNAGLTGWCGLAMLIAKMPWNKVKS